MAVKTGVSGNPEADLAKLKEEESFLKGQLSTVSTKEKTEIEKKLAINKDSQEKTEKVIQEKTLLALGNTTAEKKQALESAPGSDPLKDAVLNRVSETNNSESQLEDPVLEKTSQLTLLDATAEYLNSQKIFEESGQTVLTEAALKEQKRRFSIEIGEIESELQKAFLDK